MNFYVILAFTVVSITVPTLGQSCSKDKPCETTACCSQWGFCGFGPDFCGSTCVRDCDKRPECGEFSLTPECPLKVCCSQYGFCGTTNDFCSQCQSNCNAPVKQKCAANTASVRVGYYASWARDRVCYPYFADNINPRSYTHLNYAFGQISGGVMIPPTGSDLSEIKAFNDLKLVNGDLKTLISVGGWAFNDPGPTQQEFHNICLTSASRTNFINSVLSYLETFGFDGIDIDYEYPSAPDRGGSPEDKQNFLQLVKEMRAAFGSRYLITIAAPASYWYLQHFAIGQMSQYLDFINVMTYDIHGTWDADIASLGPVVRSHTNIKEVETALELFLRDGVPSKKLVLGLAYYGRSFQLANPACTKIDCEFVGPATAGKCTNSPGTLAWFEIIDILASTGSKPVYDADTMSKILVFNTDQWVAYDDEETLLSRQDYAGENCLLGTMVWSIDQGVDQTSGSKSLRQNGKLNINNVHLYSYLVVRGWEIVRLLAVTATYRYTGDEVNGYSVTVSSYSSDPQSPSCDAIQGTPTLYTVDTSSSCSATPTPTPTPPTNPSADEFWSNIIAVLRDDPNVYDIFEYPEYFDNEPLIDRYNDPTVRVYVRRIGNVYRVEYAEAIVFPRHLGQRRSDFTDADLDYMIVYLNGVPQLDERGHIIATSFGARAVWYNLTPQHPIVNGNRGINDHPDPDAYRLISWIIAEGVNRRWLQRERDAGRLDSYFRWQVALFYDNLETGRASYFAFNSTMFRNNIIVNENATNVYYLCNGGPNSYSCN